MTEAETNKCPYPDTVYLADPHIQQNIKGFVQVIGLFTSAKPTDGAFYEYVRVNRDLEVQSSTTQTPEDGNGK